ncbi:ABC transporter substrate-binding protein [Acuticoccus sp. MNP-M23]|uniref:ABC transporter substrate-binding protein n=1 Tax=Acuticoccus sp. MNP-M23 TaxID=3072793 RepID=UPI00281568D9|nr:ABC transporter substrate-binding protein [Acuticoccus sp. MNP-M23]WMS41658.1 ABC transporter substrate-binding protein [Acuticoccus sp. MNP-M23]
MIRTALVALIAMAGVSSAFAQSGDVPQMQEIPTLANTHEGLPPVAERIPLQPLVVDLAAEGRSEGVYGGDLRTMIGRSKDVRLINVWGYARLVGFDKEFMLVPDILEDVEEEDGRVFTFHLREGHKWSDGAPFTAEDFRYYFDEVATNTELSPTPPPFLLSGNMLPDFEVLDEVTVRYTFAEPNPRFLPTLAQASPPFIYRPSHYLKQFNPKYGDEAKIAAMVEEARVRSWAPLHNLKDEMYDATNPDLPSLQPWVATQNATDRRFVMARNPYFHRVTSTGHQLPYIDRVIMSVVDGSLIATKVQAGDADLQARGLVFGDLPVLKRGEKKRHYSVRLWPQANAAAIALYPNLTVNDPELRKLFRDRRFRQAMSLAVDRKLLNKVLYFGLGQPSANLVLPESPLSESFENTVMPFDIAKANALLDEMGLTERNSDGIRLMPDGRPLELIAETAGERAIEIDALELIKDTWNEIGIDLYPRPSQRDVLRNRAFSGDLALSVWAGYDNGLPSANMPPDERVPVSTMFFTGPAWGAWSMSGGDSGEQPDYPPAVELMQLFDDWMHTATAEERGAIWEKILKVHADEVLTIGTVQGVVQPVVVGDTLKNVPEEAVYGWDPGAQFGLYHPDEFYFEAGQ